MRLKQDHGIYRDGLAYMQGAKEFFRQVLAYMQEIQGFSG